MHFSSLAIIYVAAGQDTIVVEYSNGRFFQTLQMHIWLFNYLVIALFQIRTLGIN